MERGFVNEGLVGDRNQARCRWVGFICDHVKKGCIALENHSTEYMSADCLTKVLVREAFEMQQSKLGVTAGI